MRHARQHNPKYGTKITNVNVDAAIMRRADWRRIKKEAIHLTAAEQMEATKQLDERKKATTRAINDRRSGLLEAETAKQQRLATLEKQREMEDRDFELKVAEAKANEDLDEVKAMNAEMMAARVRTIRDAQLELIRQRRQEQREEEIREAKMLEDGRQAALKIYAERERMLREQRRRGGDVILAQIEEKRRNMQIQRKRDEEDRKAQMEANQKALEEDRRLQLERKKRAQDFMQECMATNLIALRRKQNERERELEEDQVIAEFNREKAAREEEYEQKVRRAKKMKEYEIAQVRKMQQRAIDTKAQEDEIRARRVEEEQARKERQRELEEVKRRQEMAEQQLKDHDDAIRLKQQRIIEMAKVERTEFERMMQVQRAKREKERLEQERKRKIDEQYRENLKNEMEMKREEKRLRPLRDLDEQKHIDEINQDYKDKIERIRQMKLDQLASEGVPEKYLADLRRKRFVIK